MLQEGRLPSPQMLQELGRLQEVGPRPVRAGRSPRWRFHHELNPNQYLRCTWQKMAMSPVPK